MNLKTENMDLIICPNCGKEVEDSGSLFGNENEIEISCLACNQRIKAEVIYVAKYTSYKAESE